MIDVDLKWIAAAVNGELIGNNIPVNAVSTDTRHLPEGALFIALQGPHFNAHDFVPQAIERGAAAVIVAKRQTLDCPQIVVADTRHALGQLGAAVKAEVAPKTVAITGSSGKTTVKEMLAAMLSKQGKVLATAGNFNNDIGVPLTLLRLQRDTEFAVVELGANHPGEIAYTSQLTRPDVAIINNVSPAHVEGFGDVHGIAKAKSEIFRGLKAKGLALTPQQSEFQPCWQRLLRGQRHDTFGTEGSSAFHATEVVMQDDGCAAFVLNHGDEHLAVQLTLPGRHNVDNALVAAAAAAELGCSLAQIVSGLTSLKAVQGRLQSELLTPQLRLIDDSYNANVGSTKAALDLLASYPGYRIMVLGDMGELGRDARQYHEEIGAYGITAGIDNLYTLGVLSQSASEVFNGHGGRHFGSLDVLVDELLTLVKQAEESVTILVKGSRSAHMERVVTALKQRTAQVNNQEGRRAC